MFYLAVYDFDDSFLSDIKHVLEQYFPSMLIDSYTDIEQLFQALTTRPSAYDVILLSATLSQQKEFNLQKRLKQQHVNFLILRIMATEGSLASFFSARHFSVLVQQNSLKKYVFSTYESNLKQIEETSRLFRIIDCFHNKSLKKIRFSDITYFETINKEIIVHTAQNEFYLYKYTLTKLEQDLGVYGFINTHRTCLVNSQHITTVLQNKVVLDDGTELPISRRKKKQIQQQLLTLFRSLSE